LTKRARYFPKKVGLTGVEMFSTRFRKLLKDLIVVQYEFIFIR
jgi:hypothetical protein